jgi:hypothetical protein
MMCGHDEEHGHHGQRGGECGCGCGGEGHGFRRHFATREERIAQLQEYLGDLRAEVQAVEERIAEIKAVG